MKQDSLAGVRLQRALIPRLMMMMTAKAVKNCK